MNSIPSDHCNIPSSISWMLVDPKTSPERYRVQGLDSSSEDEEDDDVDLNNLFQNDLNPDLCLRIRFKHPYRKSQKKIQEIALDQITTNESKNKIKYSFNCIKPKEEPTLFSCNFQGRYSKIEVLTPRLSNKHSKLTRVTSYQHFLYKVIDKNHIEISSLDGSLKMTGELLSSSEESLYLKPTKTARKLFPEPTTPENNLSFPVPQAPNPSVEVQVHEHSIQTGAILKISKAAVEFRLDNDD